jgi:hypothetical protein
MHIRTYAHTHIRTYAHTHTRTHAHTHTRTHAHTHTRTHMHTPHAHIHIRNRTPPHSRTHARHARHPLQLQLCCCTRNSTPFANLSLKSMLPAQQCARKACGPCIALKAKCTQTRPCERCVGKGLDCVEVPRKPRQKKHKQYQPNYIIFIQL